MPELPEVETIARGLQKAVAGKQIVSAEVRLSKVVSPERTRFVAEIAGALVALGLASWLLNVREAAHIPIDPEESA